MNSIGVAIKVGGPKTNLALKIDSNAVVYFAFFNGPIVYILRRHF